MTSTNDTYRTAVATATKTKADALAAAEMAHQSTIDAAKTVVGYREGYPTGAATFQAAIAAANTTLQQARANAEMARQAAVAKAADTARAAGELPT